MSHNHDKDENLTSHEYDGIKECDNKLPNWWLYIFYVTIVFSVGYMFYYHWGDNVKTYAQEFDKAEAERQAQQPTAVKETKFTEESLVAAFKDENKLKAGAAIFAARCVSCHGKDGGGGIGPNLVDDYWIHGGSLVQIASTVSNGVPDKGMVQWSLILNPEEIVSVSAYVRSLRGTKAENPKAPQGIKESL